MDHEQYATIVAQLGRSGRPSTILLVFLPRPVPEQHCLQAVVYTGPRTPYLIVEPDTDEERTRWAQLRRWPMVLGTKLTSRKCVYVRRTPAALAPLIDRELSHLSSE